MKKAYVFLNDGFEETEAVVPIDMMIRAGVEVVTVSLTGNDVVKGAHGIHVLSDLLFENGQFDDADVLFLPGGPGSLSFSRHEGLRCLLEDTKAPVYIAAICAAPSQLGELGLLKGKKAVCFPGYEDTLEGAEVLYEPVCIDGNLITSRGAGCAFSIAWAMIEVLCGQEKVKEIQDSIVFAK